jgi:hypothetical protein
LFTFIMANNMGSMVFVVPPLCITKSNWMKGLAIVEKALGIAARIRKTGRQGSDYFRLTNGDFRKGTEFMQKMLNYINGEWVEPNVTEYFDVINPATGQRSSQRLPSARADVDAAAKAASEALPCLARMPVKDRVQYLFKLRDLMQARITMRLPLITNECGKTFEEAKAEMVRAIENIEVACGMPMMMKGEFVEDIAPGIDELMIRQPVGVCATIAPFNFPGMIPFWYLPYALAAGNTYIVKPSEKVPTTMQFIFKLIEQVGFPKGVVNLVNGAKEAVDGILEHPCHSRHHLRRLDGCCEIHLCHRRRAWQTRAGAGRSEEPGHCVAGCGYGHGDQDHRGLRLRMRGTTLSRRLFRSDGWYCPKYIYRADM